MGFFSAFPIIGSIAEKIIGIIDKEIPDKDLREKLKTQIQLQLLDLQKEIVEQIQKEVEERAKVIRAEVNSESWLTRNWRPITMLTFLALMVAYYVGLTPPNLDKATVAEMLSVIKIGLGGYIVGRSVEKAVRYLKGK